MHFARISVPNYSCNGDVIIHIRFESVMTTTFPNKKKEKTVYSLVPTLTEGVGGDSAVEFPPGTFLTTERYNYFGDEEVIMNKGSVVHKGQITRLRTLVHTVTSSEIFSVFFRPSRGGSFFAQSARSCSFLCFLSAAMRVTRSLKIIL